MKTKFTLATTALVGAAIVIGQMRAGAAPDGPQSDHGRSLTATNEGVELDAQPIGQIGPDVIVGALNSSGPYRWAGDGTKTSYSIGTTSCNVGDVPLEWIDENDSNRHPAIAQNIYRLKDGQFEQIGLSWLKHGFCALQQGLCGSCNPYGSCCCDHLGVGCSDPHSATRNGGQGPLGPRWQVNPNTGYFPFPPADPAYSGPYARRIIVQNQDLDAVLNPGALYFGEAQYVAPDDAEAGNQNNNASYRQISVGAAPNYSMLWSGGTQQEDPAIQAWKDNQPSVTLVDVQVSSGQFLLGYDVTDNGDGTWHYEYALYNKNNEQAARMFAVPIGAGVTVTNIGFHDIDHHSGDGEGNITFDDTDWPYSIGGATLSWSCETYGDNNNANALRWGTLYNFRFDADSPPTDVDVTIGLFKTGGPASTTAPVQGPADLASVCEGDLNDDDVVGPEDLSIVLGNWGPNPGHPADINGDGVVGPADLAVILGNWGPC